jgi:hypothetical protein
LSGGKATFTTATLALGSHSITASYGGDTNFIASVSAILTQTVKPATTTTLSSSLNPSSYGQTVTFTATVSATSGTPTGAVTFKDGSTVLGTGTVTSGKATFTTTTLSAKIHSITAVYSGDSTFAGSTSSILSQTVNKASTSASVTSSLNPSVFGQSVTFAATVKPAASGTPTGAVTFKDGANTLGTGALSSGKASFSTTALAKGSHSITAVYAGDVNFTASTSSALTQAVN